MDEDNSKGNRTIQRETGVSEDGQAKYNSKGNSERNAMRKKMLGGGSGVTGATGVKPEAAAAQNDGVPILFATPTCPNCKIACQYMDKAGFTYKKLMADENADLARSYGVKQAPTLVLPDGTKLAGAGAIKQYVTTIA